MLDVHRAAPLEGDLVPPSAPPAPLPKKLGKPTPCFQGSSAWVESGRATPDAALASGPNVPGFQDLAQVGSRLTQ